MQRSRHGGFWASQAAVVLAVWLLTSVGARAQAAPTVNDADASRPSLAALLAGRSAGVDPALAELRALQGELSARAAAVVAKAALARAQTALDAAQALTEQKAPAARITRQKQLAWAALSWADRLIARADAAAALREAEARTLRAEAQAHDAKQESAK